MTETESQFSHASAFDAPSQIDTANLFNGAIKRPSVGPLYTIGLAGVTVVMAILPLLYLALVALVAYATYYHAFHNFRPIMGLTPGLNPRVAILKFFIYVTPLFAGVILTLFMVKPIFARRIDTHQPYGLNPAMEPDLYAFIARICNQVGAAMPSLIELDCRVNAAAKMRYGFKSFFTGELTLVLGLPLAAGLTAREFAGVIAHELGHCTQGVAMRLFYIISWIDGWFAEVIFERDSWDAWLEDMAETEEGWTSFMVAFARLGVWFSRKVLLLLLLVGHGFMCFLSRRMEFHADQFEIRLAGSPAFESVIERMRVLNQMYDSGLLEMYVQFRANKRLPDNLPQFMLNTEKSLRGAAVKKELSGQLGFVTTGLFHTHPSDADRVRRARQADAPGVITLDVPATTLFANFPAASRIVTMMYYEGIGLPVAQAKIFEVQGAVAPRNDEAEPPPQDPSLVAVNRFFFGIVSPLRPIFPGTLEKIADHAIPETLAAIQALPSQINAIADTVSAACQEFEEADADMLQAAQSGGEIEAARERRDQTERSLRSVFDACAHRLNSALALANTDAFASLSPNATKIRQRSAEAIRDLALLRPILRAADPLRVTTATLVQASEPPKVITNQIRETMVDIEASLRDIQSPWKGPKGNCSLYEFYKSSPASQEVFLLTSSDSLTKFLHQTYLKKLGDLILQAEEIIQTANKAFAPVRH